MKKIIFIYLCLFSTSFVFAQNKRVADSLRSILATKIQDTVRIKLLDELSYEYKTTIDSGLYYANEALALSQKINNKKFEGYAKHTIGYLYYTNKDYKNALQAYNEALVIRRTLKNANEILLTLNTIAVLFYAQGNYSSALSYFQEGLTYAEKSGNKVKSGQLSYNIGLTYQQLVNFNQALEAFYNCLRIREDLADMTGLISVYIAIANVHKELSNTTKAIEFTEKALTISKKINDKKGIANGYTSLAGICNMDKKHEEALLNYEKALAIYKEINNEKLINNATFNIAIVHKNLGNYDKSEAFFIEAFQQNEKHKDVITAVFIREGLAFLNLKKNNYDESIKYGLLALELANQLKMPDRIIKINEILYQAYEGKKDYEHTFKHFFHLTEIKDSVFSVEKHKAVSNLTSTLELERKQREMVLLEKDNELNKLTTEKQAKELEITKKQAEAEQLMSLARAEKDKRKQDSLLNLAQKAKLEAKNLQIEAENLQIQQEKQDLAFKAEREEQKRIQYTYLGVVGTFLIILILIGIGFKQKQKANKQLAAQNNEIKTQNEEIKTQNAEIKKQQLEIAEKNTFLNVANEELKQQQEELYVLNENLEAQNQTIAKTYHQLKHTTEQLDKSIQYASHIQSVVMPEKMELSNFFSELFVLFRPRDVVSGDFYWFSQISENHAVFSLSDCTGHGVPGAFMSMLGATLLHETVNIKKITDDPARILRNVHQGIRKILKQANKKNNDGMDISLCVFKKNPENKTVELIFSGAKSTMSYITNGEIFDLKGDKQYLGGEDLKHDFTNQQLILPENTIFYLYSDGYQDQNNPERKKIGSKKFKEILLDIHTKNTKLQQSQLEHFLDTHQDNSEQRDDISVVGLKI